MGVGGRAGRPKNYRHKIFGRTKKVVTGQSQNTIFACFKSILAYPRFGHVMDMLRIVAYLSNQLRNYVRLPLGYTIAMNGCHLAAIIILLFF